MRDPAAFALLEWRLNEWKYRANMGSVEFKGRIIYHFMLFMIQSTNKGEIAHYVFLCVSDCRGSHSRTELSQRHCQGQVAYVMKMNTFERLKRIAAIDLEREIQNKILKVLQVLLSYLKYRNYY